jgi:hypothetical protein
MYEVTATLEGLVPLMYNRFWNPEETNGRAKTRAQGPLEEELTRKLYVDERGVYVPADNLRMMLIGNQLRPGAALILGSQIEKRNGKKYREFCKACVWVVGEHDPLKVYIQPNRKTYDDYDERTFINSSGSRSLLRRPLVLTPWHVTFTVQVTDDQMEDSKIREMYEVAGLRCGLGAYGPTFGRCRVTQWELR